MFLDVNSSDFETVLNLEPGNKQAVNELMKLKNVSVLYFSISLITSLNYFEYFSEL